LFVLAVFVLAAAAFAAAFAAEFVAGVAGAFAADFVAAAFVAAAFAAGFVAAAFVAAFAAAAFAADFAASAFGGPDLFDPVDAERFGAARFVAGFVDFGAGVVAARFSEGFVGEFGGGVVGARFRGAKGGGVVLGFGVGGGLVTLGKTAPLTCASADVDNCLNFVLSSDI
jgi:hypothetical protein